MALELTRQQAKVLLAFRRSSMATDVRSIVRGILDARREVYENTEPASEAARQLVQDTKETLNILFDDEVTVKE